MKQSNPTPKSEAPTAAELIARARESLGDWVFSYKKPVDPTPEQRQVAMAASVPRLPFPVPRPPAPHTIKPTELFQAYARHLRNVVGLDASGVNTDGDVILVTPESVAEFIALPCKAGYSVHEQTLVVKIAARDLLDRYCVERDGGGDDGSAPSPVSDWLAAALGDPSQSRGMCAQFGYIHEPEIRRRGTVGLKRRR